MSASLRRNIPLFVAFRVLFHARFYYPIIGVLFLDLGLTLEQYAWLNVIWAAVIIVLSIEGNSLPGDRETKNLYERANMKARKIINGRDL